MIDSKQASLADLEIKHQAHETGYKQGLEDALTVILSILQHNDIRMKPKEFWAEYKNLKSEGVIK